MSAKQLQISQHADFEMKRRGIRHGDVARVIRSPGQVLPSRKGRHIYQGFLGRARRVLLPLIVKEDASAYHVVTAYKTSKVAKYWRTP